ncbi:MAG: protease modulator HflC [Desulfobacteraceae bacterium]|nr:protease modulator HflC [Desulfobacteraceae bacterium]
MKTKVFLIILAVIVGVGLFGRPFYIVDETEQVVVTQFGRVIGEPTTNPGLKFKLPFIQQATYFPKNLLEWDGDPGQIPTLEKTYIWVDAFARWKIVDPVKFFQTVENTVSAQGRLDDIIDPAIRNFVTSYSLIETVRQTNREMDTFEVGIGTSTAEQDDQIDKRPRYIVNTGREKITQGILAQAQPKLAPFGIELVDVKIKRINYVEQVQKSVYNRMIAERKQIAEKFRSEGQGEARRILGEKERELKRISSEAYRTAQEIKGKADAESTQLYAEAFGVDPEFYSFTKTLEIYAEALGEQSSLILSTDSEFLRFLKSYKAETSAQ